MNSSKFKHNPGGKVKRQLPDYVVGEEKFSECGMFRPWLRYSWPHGVGSALVCAMNPSVAEAGFADPTVAKVRDYVEHILGFSSLVMTNVLDYRATDPTQLTARVKIGEIVNSSENLPTILAEASTADMIILAHGNLPPSLSPFGVQVAQELLNAGHEVFCWGVNKSGAPKHPLYLRKDAPLQPYTDADLMRFAAS